MFRYVSFVASQMALVVKTLPTDAGDGRDIGSIPGMGRSLGRGHGNPLQYSCLENHMDRGAWQATVHSVPQSWKWLKWLSMYIWVLISKNSDMSLQMTHVSQMLFKNFKSDRTIETLSS